MKVYRLQHTPTGLYYTPSKGNGNLSKTGKIYSKPPSLTWIRIIRIKIFSWKREPHGHHKTIVDYFNLDWNNGRVDTHVKTKPEDWKIIEL